MPSAMIGGAAFFSGQAKQHNTFLYYRQLFLTIFIHGFPRADTSPWEFVSHQKHAFPYGKVVDGQLAVRH
ncbi:hypothetical protein [Massilia timonae]|uniref:hypothetical protein n=2 Tax=Massilia TaxID=149698 RepID=UPI002896750A|nr:hypothetical protein [Massilia timonae]